MPGPGYGYKTRKDPAPRDIAGGSSRIHLPESDETRRTDIVSKTNFGVPTVIQANVDDFLLWPRTDGLGNFIGKHSAGAGGAQFWAADIFRYCRRIQIGTSGVVQRTGLGISPRALVDPLFPPSGIILKVQDIVRAFFSGALNAQHGKCYFGIGPFVISTADPPPASFVGWRAFYNVLNVQPTWSTLYSNKDGTITRLIDSGLTCDVQRTLSTVFDGKTQTIRWYANGVLVDTYAPSSGEVGGQVTSLGNDCVGWGAMSSATGAVATIDFLMLPAPTITIQFPDA